MAIVKVFKAKDNINRLLKYISNPIKTQNGLLVSGKDCSANTCYDEMQSIKELYDKKDGYTAFHFVQSFSPKDNLSYEKAHEIGLQFAEYFKGYQVLFATHTDRDHIHTHFVVNSVSFKDGKKFHMSKKDLEKIKEFSNKLCEENGLNTINLKKKNKVKDISKNEYAVAKKGESWKFKLMNDIDYCMSISSTKEEYIKNMENLNYQVVWTDTRKYITYTTPEGHKCRDKNLHEVKYLKEEMENEFRRNEKNESEFSRTNTNEETGTRDKTSDRNENTVIYNANRASGENLSEYGRNERVIQESKFKNNQPINNGSNGTTFGRAIESSSNGQDSERTSIPNAGVQNTSGGNKQKEKDVYDTRGSNRNSDRYCDNAHYNPTIETLRHLAYVMQNMTYIGPRRNIRGCYSGDLSKQARREWAILHRNSDSFEWYEDDMEI